MTTSSLQLGSRHFHASCCMFGVKDYAMVVACRAAAEIIAAVGNLHVLIRLNCDSIASCCCACCRPCPQCMLLLLQYWVLTHEHNVTCGCGAAYDGGCSGRNDRAFSDVPGRHHQNTHAGAMPPGTAGVDSRCDPYAGSLLLIESSTCRYPGAGN